MDSIIEKLSFENIDLRYLFLINNISFGLKLALDNKVVKNNSKAYKCLNDLSTEIKYIPLPYNYDEINFENQQQAYNIGLYAKEVIEGVIGTL